MTRLPQELPLQVLDALRKGRAIEAIKLLRSLQHLGLKDAKHAIDQARSELHELQSAAPRHEMPPAAAPLFTTPEQLLAQRAPGEVPRSGGGIVVVLLLLVLALGAYFIIEDGWVFW